METPTPNASACRHCRNYQPEGRRGGHCQQLGVPVQSGWAACPLALTAFKSAWELLESHPSWQDAGLTVQEVLVTHHAHAESRERLTMGQFVG